MKVELIKAYCKKTGKKFCLEINKKNSIIHINERE